MNSLKNRLNALKLKDSNKVVEDKKVEEKEKKENYKKSFIHGNQVMFVNSASNKGMIGFVQDFFPGKYQVTIKETGEQRKNRLEKIKMNQISRLYPDITNDEKIEYIKSMGKNDDEIIFNENVKIGDKIATQYGMVVVEDLVPKMYTIQKLNGDIVNVDNVDNVDKLDKKIVMYQSIVKDSDMSEYIKKINELKMKRQMGEEVFFPRAPSPKMTIILAIVESESAENMIVKNICVINNKEDDIENKIKNKITKEEFTKISWEGTDRYRRSELDNIAKNLNLEIDSSDSNRGVFEKIDNFLGLKKINVNNIVKTFGKVIKVTNPSVKVYGYITVVLSPNQIKKIDNKYLQIVKGDYKSDKKYEYIFTRSHLTVLLNSTGRKLSNHLVKTNVGTYINRVILPSDVFYFDLLTGGAKVEVVGINDDNQISVKGTDGKLNNISFDDIQEYLPGFKWTDANVSHEIVSPQDINLIDDTSEENPENTETTDTTEDSTDEGHEISGYDETDENESEQPEEIVMKSAYSDKDRISSEPEKLTSVQSDFQNIIKKIFKLYSNSDENYISVVKDTEYLLEQLNVMANKSINYPKDVYKYGYKFFLACVVFYVLKKDKNIKFDTYIKKVIPVLFGKQFKSNFKTIIDDNKYIYTLYEGLLPNNQNHIELIEKWSKNGELDQIVINMMQVSKILYDYIGNIDDSIVVEKMDVHLRPIGKGVYKDGLWVPYDKTLHNRKFITFTEIMNDGIPDKEYKILFSPGLIEIVKKYKIELQKSEKSDYNVHIVNNLHRLPFAMKEFPEVKEFQDIYNEFIKVQESIKQDKASKRLEKLTKFENSMKNRVKQKEDSVKNKIKEKYMSKEYPEDWTLTQLKEFCEKLNISKNATTKDLLIDKLDKYLGIIDQDILTYHEFLKKSYKGKNSWTLTELEEMAEELDLEFYEDSTREEIYELINEYFYAKEQKTKRPIKETTTQQEDESEIESLLNESIQMMKKQRLD